MKTIERTHIIPLGFERDVAVKPVKVLGGTKAVVILIGGEFAEKYELSEKQRHFENIVCKDLEELGLKVDVKYADLFDFEKAVNSISAAVLKEKEEGREVYINLSSHGRLVSVISALVGWYHGVRMYYVLADRYAKDEREMREHGRSICERMRILEVPNMEVVRLNREEGAAVSFIFKKNSEGRSAKLEDLLDEFCETFPDVYSCEKDLEGKWKRVSKQENLTKLNRRVISKLESKGFIEKEKTGRNVFLRLTNKGKVFALLEYVGD